MPCRYSSLWRPPLVLRNVARRRYLEAAARSLAPLAALVGGHACNFGDQGLGHSANLRVVRRHPSQWAAVAADDRRTVVSFLEFSETTQFVEHPNRHLEPRVHAIRLCVMFFG